MNKLICLVFCSLILFACTPNSKIISPISPTGNILAGCQTGDVEIKGYGEKGKRLANCFVEYPGQPTRQDKTYYIVEDICGQFTPELISNLLGKKIINTKLPEVSTYSNCTYYTDDKNYVMLVLSYLNAQNQKRGHESLGRKVVTESKIPINNWVVYQEDGLINSIYLILSNDKYINIQRTKKIDLSTDQLIGFASKIGEVIKNYK